MSPFLTELRLTSCPKCGQEVLKIVRRLRAPSSADAKQAMKEPCHECLLAAARPFERSYLLRAWRQQWQRAGGKMADLPACLRLPEDTPASSPTALPRLTPVAALSPRGGSDTPVWKPPTRVLCAEPSPRTRRPNVLFVTHDLQPQGAQRILLGLLPHLRGMNIQLFAIAGGSLAPSFEQAGIPVLRGAWPHSLDLVVVNTLAAHPAVSKAKELGIPCLWFCHEWATQPWLDPQMYADLAASVRLNVFVHAAQRQQFPQVKDGQARIIPSVIQPMLRGDRIQSRASLTIADDAFHVVTFGMDETRKGQQDLRQASSDLPMRVDYVYGQVDTSAWLSSADVYVSTSRAECYPLSTQEAKACRLPVIATNLPVHRDMIESGVNGYLYEPGDVEALRDLLVRLQTHPELRRELGDRAINGMTWEHSLLARENVILLAAGGASVSQDLLHVVYHVCGMGEFWRDVVREQLSSLKAAGLARLYISHCGEGLAWLQEQGLRLGMELIVCCHDDSVLVYERPAIQLTQWLAHSSDKPILYLHTKGVSYREPNPVMEEWRRLMMDELVPAWRRHVAKLEEYDAVGVNWWERHNKWHFSGNFWFAHPRWLRQLPPIASYWRDRFSAERWVGAIPGCKPKSLLCENAAFWGKDRQLLAELRNVQRARQKGGD